MTTSRNRPHANARPHAGASFSSGVGGRSATVFETLEAAFWWLCTGHGALRIHGRRLAGLPDQPLPLYQLRVRLASSRVSPPTRAAVWRYLVGQARTRGPLQNSWTVGCAGLALPELSRIVGSLSRGFSGDLDDLEAAALGAFLGELRRVDLDNLADHRLRLRLLMAAYRGARALRDTHPGTTGHAAPGTTTGTAAMAAGAAVAAVLNVAPPSGPASRAPATSTAHPAHPRDRRAEHHTSAHSGEAPGVDETDLRSGQETQR